MPSCSPSTPPSPTPYELLQQAAQAVASLAPTDSAQHVTACYQAFQRRLRALAWNQQDMQPYQLAMRLTERFAVIDVANFQNGDLSALSKLQIKVKGAMACLP